MMPKNSVAAPSDPPARPSGDFDVRHGLSSVAWSAQGLPGESAAFDRRVEAAAIAPDAAGLDELREHGWPLAERIIPEALRRTRITSADVTEAG
jgi:hypothetical protein